MFKPQRGIMRYPDGSPANLGDIVSIPMPGGSAKARIVMLGDTGEHLDIDEICIEWIEREKLLGPSEVVIEWLDRNPVAHNDPRYAPADNYMFTELDCCVARVND